MVTSCKDSQNDTKNKLFDERSSMRETLKVFRCDAASTNASNGSANAAFAEHRRHLKRIRAASIRFPITLSLAWLSYSFTTSLRSNRLPRQSTLDTKVLVKGKRDCSLQIHFFPCRLHFGCLGSSQ